jgi:hypothetical protein
MFWWFAGQSHRIACRMRRQRSGGRWLARSQPTILVSRATHPMLEAYCRHAVATRQIDQLVQRLDGEGTLPWAAKQFD